jgi:MYXO-CTERM domain-containing protein
VKTTIAIGQVRIIAVAALAAVIGMLGFAVPAAAQVSLDGTYIDYVSVRSNGAYNLAAYGSPGQSMRYSETGAAPYTCDLYAQGTQVDELTIEATSGATTRLFTNTGDGVSNGIPTVSTATVVGSTITWRGSVTAAPFNLTVDQIYSLNDAGRFVRLDVVITNNSATALSNVYYLRNGDPDPAGCIGTTNFATRNDVVRQPPTDGQALVTVGTPTGTTPVVFFGMGSCDPRARAHSNYPVDLNNTDPSGTFAAPHDAGGLAEDTGVAVVLRETSLAAGASLSFRIYWVWGPDAATVTTRFLAAACTPVEGDPCLSGGVLGTLHGGVCCTTCWNGTACMPGTTADACGVNGRACTSCNDGNVCSSDACTAGACTHAPLPGGTCDDGWWCTLSDTCDAAGLCTGAARVCDDGSPCTTDFCDEAIDACSGVPAPGFCVIAGACFAPGAGNPSNICQVCDPARSGSAWSPAAVGTTCDDGLWCTVGDACSAAGACAGTTRNCTDAFACTTEACDEASDTCISIAVAGTCFIDGTCFGTGARNPANTCQLCDPAISSASWSPAPVGRTCDDGLWCTPTDACDAAGACTGSGTRCDDALACTANTCVEVSMTCDNAIDETACVIGGACVASGDPNPANACQACTPGTSHTAWSPLATGTICGDPQCAAGMLTPAPTCDATGGCIGAAATPCPSGTCRDATACLGPCTADSDCPADEYCAGDPDGCQPDLADGQVCDREAQCTSGHCVDGFCCDTACDGTCEACDLTASLGACTPYPAGTDPEDECPDNTCNGAGACNGADADGGTDDGGAEDGGSGDDGIDTTGDTTDQDATGDGGGDEAGGGCGCRATGTGTPFAALSLVFGLLALAVFRRRKQ